LKTGSDHDLYGADQIAGVTSSKASCGHKLKFSVVTSTAVDHNTKES